MLKTVVTDKQCRPGHNHNNDGKNERTINIVSTVGLVRNVGQANYTEANSGQAGVIGFTKVVTA